eukprot:SAG31_NODE_5551_length_2464_cov_1.834249_4_plen_144_part_00
MTLAFNENAARWQFAFYISGVVPMVLVLVFLAGTRGFAGCKSSSNSRPQDEVGRNRESNGTGSTRPDHILPVNQSSPWPTRQAQGAAENKSKKPFVDAMNSLKQENTLEDPPPVQILSPEVRGILEAARSSGTPPRNHKEVSV